MKKLTFTVHKDHRLVSNPHPDTYFETTDLRWQDGLDQISLQNQAGCGLPQATEKWGPRLGTIEFGTGDLIKLLISTCSKVLVGLRTVGRLERVLSPAGTHRYATSRSGGPKFTCTLGMLRLTILEVW